MNRAERRRVERETKEQIVSNKSMMEWFSNWTPQQKEFHKNMVSAMLDEVNEITEKVIDSCYIASMIQTLDLNLEQCEEVAKQANEYMIEVKRIIDEKKEGYFKMVKDEKLRSEIKEEAKIIIKENRKINNLRVIDALKENYKLPSKDLQIIIKEARQELAEATMKELESSIVKEKCATGEVKATLANEGEHGFEITADKTGTKINGLKIKSIEIEGKYGTYVKGSEGVKTGDKVYKDITDLEREKEATKGDIKDQREEFNKKLAEINLHLRNLDEIEKEESEKFAEISAVFEM